MNVFYDKDCDLSLIKGKKVTVLGYGSQGHAHALNLHDSGVDVTVGLRKNGASWSKAEGAGLKVKEVNEAVKDADIVTVVTSGAAKPFIDDKWLKPGVLLSLPAEMRVPKDFMLSCRKVIDNKAMHQLWKEFQNCEGDFHENVGIISSYMIQYIDEGLMTWDDVTNIGDIIAGKAPGRTSHDESILFCMGGMPVSDVAWGTEVYNKALEMGIGTKLNLWDEPYKL